MFFLGSGYRTHYDLFLYNCFLFTKLHHQRHNNTDLLNLKGKSHADKTGCKYQHPTTQHSTLGWSLVH